MVQTLSWEPANQKWDMWVTLAGVLTRQILTSPSHRFIVRAPHFHHSLIQRPVTWAFSQRACLDAYENEWCFLNVLLCFNPPLKLMFLNPGAAVIGSQPSAPASSRGTLWLAEAEGTRVLVHRNPLIPHRPHVRIQTVPPCLPCLFLIRELRKRCPRTWGLFYTSHLGHEFFPRSSLLVDKWQF